MISTRWLNPELQRKRSIHPRAIDWKPAPMPKAAWGKVTGKECRLGYVFLAASGLWQATRYPNFDCGEHKTIKRAMRAVEEFQ